MDNDTRTPLWPSRRNFLKQAVGAGLAVGIGPWLASCGFSNGPAPSGETERRTHYFDLSNADPDHDYYLVAGAAHYPLYPVTLEQLAAARANSSELLRISDERITHIGTAELPSDRIQMCYVKGVARDAARTPGAWSMHMMFYHIPSATADVVGKALAACGKASGSRKFEALEGIALAGLGIGQAHATEPYSYCTDPGYDDYKAYFDQAVALVCHHPEVGSFDAATLSYVMQSIVCPDAGILELAVSLYQQGPATTTPGGWATLVEVIDPDTGQAEVDANGYIQYFVQHSPKTLMATGAAIRNILPSIKNDPVLGANITDLQADTDNAALNGKLWVVNNGTPTRTYSQTSLRSSNLADGDTVVWKARDVSHFYGYGIGSVAGTADRIVYFTVSNWFVRYLGLFIRYLDGNGKPIAFADLPITIRQQFKGELSGTYDCFLSLINQEFVVLGIPIQQDQQRFGIQVPEMAASFQILAGGLGTGSNDYPKTIGPGAVMTVVLDLAIPGVFLALAACSGYKAFKTKVNAPASREALVDVAKLLVLAISDSVLAGVYYHPETFKNLAFPLLSALKSSGTWLNTALKDSLAEGEATTFLPFGVGLALQAVMALGTAAEISETSAEICNSPWTYVTEVSATHDLTVSIAHDPRDTAGFPSTATHYRLFAVCDGSSPYDSGAIAMPESTRTAPLIYTFPGLPSGGKVNISVVFYSETGWLAGAGSTGPIDNIADTATITIKEVLVPLTSTTVYGHKQKIVLDMAGHHVWQASGAAPFAQTNCDNMSGNLCNLVGITLSEHFGALGYAWMASSSGVRSFSSGARGQMYQFANISFTQTPESGYKFSGGGFDTPARLAYDLSSSTSRGYYIDTSSGSNIVRRIAMNAIDTPPTIDTPASGLSVGRFNHASDGFLIHPTGKLISINTALSKLEVLVPADVPIMDAAAPLAQAYSGPGSRDGLILAPTCIALSHGGAILVLEQANNRIQAFDTGANPTLIFANGTSSYMPLKPAGDGAIFMDLAVETVGYIYVLSARGNVYTLDIYDPQGVWLSATKGINAGKLTVDLFRNIYTLNFETLKPIGDITEPSISQWIPSTP